MKPFLKWVGGKTQILPDIIAKFPTHIKNYYEPFLGGGSVLFGLLSAIESGHIQVSGDIYASDANRHLIMVYQVLQTQCDDFICQLTNLSSEFNTIPILDKTQSVDRNPQNHADALLSHESYYYWIRSEFNSNKSTLSSNLIRSAYFIFLNKVGFRGIYREGPNGFNVPFGHHTTFNFDPTYLKKLSHILNKYKVKLTVSSFEHILKSPDLNSGDFIYLDPPYAPETATSFVGYQAGGFTETQHLQLFQLLHTMTSCKVSFLMSNAHVNLVTQAFPSSDYQTQIIPCRRAINSKNPAAKTNEVLIQNRSNPLTSQFSLPIIKKLKLKPRSQLIDSLNPSNQ
jgi:DNA adenine methylase